MNLYEGQYLSYYAKRFSFVITGIHMPSQNKIIISVIVLLVFLVGAWSVSQGGRNSLTEEDQEITPPSITSPIVSNSQEEVTQTTQRIQIFVVALEDAGKGGEEIGCGDSLIPVTREITQTKAVLQASLKELFSLKDQYYGESGLYNALYQSNLTVESAAVENGTAVIRLTGQLMLGGVCDNPRVEGQIRKTAEQFSSVQNVEIYLNGKPLQESLSGR